MLIDQKVKTKWNNKHKQHYIDLGYPQLNHNEEFELDVHDLATQSKVRVLVKCDYCGKVYLKPYFQYNTSHTNNPKDACEECKAKKINETILQKYGVSRPMKLKEHRDKHKQIIMDKYGVPNVWMLPEIKQKIKDSMMKNWGVDHPMHCPEIVAKLNDTLYRHGNCKTSKAQFAVYETLLNDGHEVYLNYPCGKYTLDIALFVGDVMIDVEYDGWYWHHGNEQFDILRDDYTRKCGWKTIRIRSNENIPRVDELTQCIRSLVNTNIDYSAIVMDDWIDKECSSYNNN
jgi:very-short-patch-repair endonuclease